ncbi:MAG: M1 family metallopeptidase [Balneolaceae bacterium]
MERSPEEIFGTVDTNWTVPEGEPQTLRERDWDLLHQKIWVRFDFGEEKVLGTTELLLTSLDEDNDELVLDGKTMEIDRVELLPEGTPLEVEQDSAKVFIRLPEAVSKQDTLVTAIEYTASPPNRGLYFTDPAGLDPDIPTQIHTLGQPEDNSFWLPTIDHPAERSTQETWIAVPDSFQTVSNGRLMEQRIMPGDTLRTDYWVMDRPHAPYLFAVAVGQFYTRESYEDGIFYRFFVEPEFRDSVEEIFKPTAEAGRFMEEKTGVTYPWYLYQQVPVRNFIAGGMENTTATFLHEDIQFHGEASHAQNLSNQDLIVHEFAHQWFGNYVTARNWANLPLNEGFASYFESLFRAEYNGRESAELHSYRERQAYLEQADTLRRPIIFDRYRIPEDMYDAHTYQKAALVLRMLHEEVGDAAWWRALNRYLEEFAFQAVDIRDLQTVLEEESDRSLETFFDQWFMQPGHPVLGITHTTERDHLDLRVVQLQDTTRQPVFDITTPLEIETDKGTQRHSIRINRVDSTYRFALSDTLRDVRLDPDDRILAEIKQPGIDTLQIENRLKHSSLPLRLETLAKIKEKHWSEHVERMVLDISQSAKVPEERDRAEKLLEKYAADKPG